MAGHYSQPSQPVRIANTSNSANWSLVATSTAVSNPSTSSNNGDDYYQLGYFAGYWFDNSGNLKIGVEMGFKAYASTWISSGFMYKGTGIASNWTSHSGGFNSSDGNYHAIGTGTITISASDLPSSNHYDLDISAGVSLYSTGSPVRWSCTGKLTVYSSHKVTFALNGGSGNFPDRQKTFNDKFNMPSEIPTRTNYTFEGWTSNISGDTKTYIYSASATDGGYIHDQWNGTVTLTAQWKIKGDSVILDANGGHFMNNWSEATYSTVPHDGGDPRYYTSTELGWAIRGAPYIPNHAEFIGYYDKNTFNASDIVKVYNLNESYKNVNDGNYMVVAIQNTKYFDDTSTGYSNDTNWRGIPASQGDPAQSITINVPAWILQNSETTFYALWKIKNLNIVYKNEDGTNYNTNSLSGLQNSNSIALMPLSDVPQKTGYYFNQWKDDQNNLHAAGSTYPINTGPLIPGELTFTATFGLKKYNIVLDANGGKFIHASGTPSSVDNVYNFGDTDLSIMYKGIPKHPKGWTFLGYYNQATGEQVYKPSENITWENTQYTYTEDDYDIQDEYVYAAEPVENTRYWKTETADVDFTNAAHWKQLTPETKKMVSWNYNGTHNETIRLVARWRPKTNTYIYDPSDSEEPWKTAYIYINIAAPGEEPIWQSISAVTFL